MRDFLNAILSFIEASSLTNEEFDSLTVSVPEYTKEVYEALLGVLESRESVSNTRDRLRYYFLARGVEVDEPKGRSNIFVGGVLG